MRVTRCAVLAGSLFIACATSEAQDFRKIVEIVDEMETSLRKMIAHEEMERKADIVALRQEINRLRVSGPVADSGKAVNSGAGSTLVPGAGRALPADSVARADKTCAGLAELAAAVSHLSKELTEARKVAGGEAAAEPAAGESGRSDPWVVSGLVDLSFNHNFASPGDRTNRMRSLDARSDQFDVNLVKLGVKSSAEPLGFCLELGFGSTSDVMNTIDGSVDETFKMIHQAYVSGVVPVGNGIKLDAGKFLSPIGAEVVESSANWNYTRSFLFGYAVPAFHVGVRLSYPVVPSFTVSAMLVNGFTRTIDNNSGKTFGAQLAWAPTKSFSLTGNVISGPEQTDNNTAMRTLWDAVVVWQMCDQMAVNVNYDYGYESLYGDKAIWSGVSVMSQYTFGEGFAAALRGEWFEDRLGSQTGMPQELKEITLTGDWRPQSRWLLRAEVRRDWSTKAVFHGPDAAGPETSQSTFTLGVVCEF